MTLYPTNPDQEPMFHVDFKVVDGLYAPPAGHHFCRRPAVRRADAFAGRQ